MIEQISLIGKEILTYRIESLIGKGGMGSVYLASNKHIKQNVAIKVLNANLAESPIIRQKFVQEANTLLTLDHPNIVHFLNFVENEDGVFLIMEFVDGITLEDFINTKHGLIIETKAYDLFNQILNAFDYAHKKGVIHRDIKPANIILTNDIDGNFVVKILDFGIAKIISESHEDEKDLIVGTPSYMSPEQVCGRIVDERSDIYSLGVLLHQMLTGQTPFSTTTLSKTEIQNKVVAEPLPRMKEYYQYISDRMQKVVDKATSKNPAARYSNCATFRKDFLPKPTIPLWHKTAVAVCILLLLAGGLWYWDYNHHIKTYYYKDYVEQWGVPVGIGKVDFKQREKTYKFEYKKGKLQHLSLVNSKGNVVEDGESERFDRSVNADFEYQGRDIAFILYKNKNGKPLFRKRYNKKDGKINMFVFEYNDDNGTDKRLPKDLTGYVRLEDENAERGQISRFAMEFDNNGYITMLHYWNRDGRPVCDKEHIYGKRYERDKKGRVIKEYLLAHNDSITATSWGLGVKEFSYENNNLVKVVYLSPDGQPSQDDKDGIAIYTMEYDDYGNLIYGWHQSSDGTLMIPKKSGVAGIKQVFNKNGEVKEFYYMGIDRQPMYSVKHGFIGIKKEYDEHGFVKKQTFIDENGETAICSDGVTTYEILNDNRGNQLEIRNYDINNQPFESSDGYFKIIAKYDSLGNQTSFFCYNTNDSLCLTGSGIAGQRYIFNDKNWLIEYTNYGDDGQPCDVEGIFTVKYEYDSRGNETKRSFYAADGKMLKLGNEGISGIESKYDENGNKIENSFFDIEGKRTAGVLGYATWVATYNDSGYMEELKNLDENGQLVFVATDGYAGVRYKYDNRGNRIEKFPFGTTGLLIGNVERYRYDRNDNQIELSYYDQNGKSTIGPEKYSKIVYEYNNRNQIIELRYYNTDNQLLSPNTDNYSILRYKYDNKGNTIEVACFDEDTKPVCKKEGYAIHKSEYDAMGRLIRQTFYDEKGQPTKPAVMVPEGLVEYDKWGNMNYLASADGYGKLINNPKMGWSVKRWLYDIRGNLLEIAFYDNDNKPCVDKENKVYKITYTYNGQNKKEEERYYTTSNELRKNGYAIAKYMYDDNGRETDFAMYNHLNIAADFGGWHKYSISYDESGVRHYLKFYSANKKLLQTSKFNKQTGIWEQIGNPVQMSSSSSSVWRKNWQMIAENCPYTLSEELEMVSVTLLSNGCLITLRFIDISKYNITNTELETKKSVAKELIKYLKKENDMPVSTTLSLVGTDKAQRELFRITY